MSVVMDASAVLAILFGERGADVAAASARGARLSTVNLTEILEKIARRTGTCDAVLPTLAELKIDIVPFDQHQARLAADLKPRVGKNDSFADRACLSLSRLLPRCRSFRLIGPGPTSISESISA